MFAVTTLMLYINQLIRDDSDDESLTYKQLVTGKTSALAEGEPSNCISSNSLFF